MDGRKKEKIRRIYAWVAILLFIALIINISTVQWQLGVSIGIYMFILMYYLFFLRKDKNVTTREYTHGNKKVVLDETDTDSDNPESDEDNQKK